MKVIEDKGAGDRMRVSQKSHVQNGVKHVEIKLQNEIVVIGPVNTDKFTLKTLRKRIKTDFCHLLPNGQTCSFRVSYKRGDGIDVLIVRPECLQFALEGNGSSILFNVHVPCQMNHCVSNEAPVRENAPLMAQSRGTASLTSSTKSLSEEINIKMLANLSKVIAEKNTRISYLESYFRSLEKSDNTKVKTTQGNSLVYLAPNSTSTSSTPPSPTSSLAPSNNASSGQPSSDPAMWPLYLGCVNGHYYLTPYASAVPVDPANYENSGGREANASGSSATVNPLLNTYWTQQMAAAALHAAYWTNFAAQLHAKLTSPFQPGQLGNNGKTSAIPGLNFMSHLSTQPCIYGNPNLNPTAAQTVNPETPAVPPKLGHTYPYNTAYAPHYNVNTLPNESTATAEEKLTPLSCKRSCYSASNEEVQASYSPLDKADLSKNEKNTFKFGLTSSEVQMEPLTEQGDGPKQIWPSFHQSSTTENSNGGNFKAQENVHSQRPASLPTPRSLSILTRTPSRAHIGQKFNSVNEYGSQNLKEFAPNLKNSGRETKDIYLFSCDPIESKRRNTYGLNPYDTTMH